MWRSPFREAGAFGFVLLTVVAFAAVAAAALAGGSTAALAAWAFVSVAAIALYTFGRRPEQTLRTAPAHAGAPDERSLILLAQTTLPSDSLAELGQRANRIVVVSAASPSFVHWCTSDVDNAQEQAGSRVDEAVDGLRASHVVAAGPVGDGDPLRVIEDALREFGGDEIVVATGSGARDAGVALRVRERFALPVTHVVV